MLFCLSGSYYYQEIACEGVDKISAAHLQPGLQRVSAKLAVCEIRFHLSI